MADVDEARSDIQTIGQPGPAIAKLAALQHGVVARRQLMMLGLGAGAIKYRCGVGALHSVHAGVYTVGHPVLSARGRWMAAVLACGPDALLSHFSAAASWGLRPTGRSRIDVTVEARGRRNRPGIAIHSARNLVEEDRTTHDGIPITTVARTLLDLAELALPRQVERAFHEADRLQLLDLKAIEAIMLRSRGRRGLRGLTTVLDQHLEPPPATRSELERRFLDLCRDSGLPRPEVNVQVAGLEVDAVWRRARLVVEIDGHAFHRTRTAFERDRVRDGALQLADYRVLRITHRRLEAEPAVVAGTLRSLLAIAHAET